ncbi:PIG-L family deacetylase [Sphingomonas oligophenolica]|uniref:PIG-L family deacetylase n=1 Tax=Sphingomonas oligophenolica TaxID=301154 RepID=A0A502C9P7_9SPHN|nr:PIG-L family deacetylase [Sphingomonas oligophenolica]
MKLRIGTPRCLLVIAPHPDDETIGAYALITRMRRRGVKVRILVVTDGGASHTASPTWPRHRLIRERQQETFRAVRQLGIFRGAVTFLGLPDGRLVQETRSANRLIAGAIRHAPKPLLVVAPACSDDHPDHRVVATAVGGARQARVRRLAYSVWPAGAAIRHAGAVTLSAQERLAKRHAIRSYRTQAGRIRDDPNGFAMTRAQIAAFSRAVETFVERAE